MKICKHCGCEYEKLVHARWCSANPKLEENRKQARERNTTEVASARAKKAHAEGKYKNVDRSGPRKPHTEEAKKKMSVVFSKLKHRRLVRSCREYKKKDGSSILLDSSWEEALAVRLDQLGIDWVRPGPIPWTDQVGVEHNYFADFYLPQFDIFLDPKNAQAFKVQKEKIEIIKGLMPNLIFLRSLKECKEYCPI